MKKGFSLVEILIALSIISLLTGISVINYRTKETEISLSRATLKLAQDLRRAQEMALAQKEVGGKIPKGYGISLTQDSDTYSLYFVNNLGSQEEIEKISLERGIKIKSLLIDSKPTSSASVTFKPPDPIVEVNGDKANLEIILSLKRDENLTKKIKVNKIGLISVE